MGSVRQSIPQRLSGGCRGFPMFYKRPLQHIQTGTPRKAAHACNTSAVKVGYGFILSLSLWRDRLKTKRKLPLWFVRHSSDMSAMCFVTRSCFRHFETLPQTFGSYIHIAVAPCTKRDSCSYSLLPCGCVGYFLTCCPHPRPLHYMREAAFAQETAIAPVRLCCIRHHKRSFYSRKGYDLALLASALLFLSFSSMGRHFPWIRRRRTISLAYSVKTGEGGARMFGETTIGYRHVAPYAGE